MSHEEIWTKTEDVQEHLQHPVVEDGDDEDVVEATVSQTPAVEANTIDEMEADQIATDSSGSYDGYRDCEDLAPMQPVEKSFCQLFKFRKAKTEKINLKKCLPAHYYTRKKLTRDQILQLARTCKNPYHLGPSFP